MHTSKLLFRSTKKVLVIAFGMGTIVVLLAAVGLIALTSRSDQLPPRALIVSENSTRWPTDTLEDWVNFADQISTMTIVSEEQIPPTPADQARGEGEVARSVTARIDSTLWSYGDRRAPETITFATWGWWMHDNRLIPQVGRGDVRLAVGDQVVAPLMLIDGSWAPMTPGAVILVNDARRIAVAKGRRGERASLPAVEGRSIDELSQVLTGTKVDEDLRRLDPDARAAAIWAR